MSTLYIKQKMLSPSGKFTVLDQAQQPRYLVSGSFMKIPKSFTITDTFDRPVAEITKAVFSFQPRFTVEMNGQLVATIRKEFSFFKPRYTIDGAGLDVSGDWWDMNFSVLRGGQPVATIHRKLLSWADTYEVEVLDETLEATIISLVVAIDRVRADNDGANASATF